MPAMPPPRYVESSAAPAPRKNCTFCGVDFPLNLYKDHLVDAHAELLFHCEECNTYVDRKDFILHMSLHAVQYASNTKDEKEDKKQKLIKIKKDENENDDTERLPATPPQVDTSVSKSCNNGSRSPSEFSDHSDADFQFGPLPESVFDAIEDSRDSNTASQTRDNLPQCDSQPSSSDHQTSTVENQPTLMDCQQPTSDNQQPSCDNQPPFLDHRSSLDNNSVPGDQPPPWNIADKAQKNRNKKSRTCPICAKTYNASSSYFYHMKHVHNKTLDHECEICGKKFNTKTDLTQHSYIHSTEFRFQCKMCPKRFKARASLYIHEQIHKGTKCHSCSQCNSSFRWRSHLEKHMKRHTLEKCHVCSTCGRGFSIRCDLLRHARTHTVGHYACDDCGLSFAQQRYLKVHIHKKHSKANGQKENSEIELQ